MNNAFYDSLISYAFKSIAVTSWYYQETVEAQSDDRNDLTDSL